MNLIHKLNTISKPSVKALPNGRSSSIQEIWQELMLKYMPEKDVVLAWHNLIMKYISSEHPTLAIRGYNTCSKGNYSDLRRGFLTRNEEFSFFYTDNFFAAYFQKMVLDGYVPELEEFVRAFEQRKFPSRFGRNTAEERALLSIKQGKDPKINSAGFKLAHIIPVGKDFSDKNHKHGITDILETYFPCGKRSDWVLKTDDCGEFYERDFCVRAEAKKYAVAHFVRFVHPFNYFLCPKKTCEINNKCKELAEYQPLLNYAHDFMLDYYGTAYTEFLEICMAAPEYYNPCFDKNTMCINVQYGLNISPSAKNKDTESEEFLLKEIERLKKKLADIRTGTAPNEQDNESKTHEKGYLLSRSQINAKVSADIEFKMAVEYLSNPQTSFRKLEVKYLKINSAARGGGFKSKAIINRLGLLDKHKGILTLKTIDELLASSDGVILETLKTVKTML